MSGKRQPEAALSGEPRLAISSSLSGTLSSGHMEVSSAWECTLDTRRKLPFMDVTSTFHECDSVGLIESRQIPTWI